jgi:hypothetical protein
MGEVKQYKTAGAFRTALETRLQTRAQEERTDLQLGRLDDERVFVWSKLTAAS